jgi:hypothetical protein
MQLFSMTIVKFSPLSSLSQKGVTIAKIRIKKSGSRSGWITKIRIPILVIPNLAMRSWNLRILNFLKMSTKMPDSDFLQSVPGEGHVGGSLLMAMMSDNLKP